MKIYQKFTNTKFKTKFQPKKYIRNHIKKSTNIYTSNQSQPIYGTDHFLLINCYVVVGGVGEPTLVAPTKSINFSPGLESLRI